MTPASITARAPRVSTGMIARVGAALALALTLALGVAAAPPAGAYSGPTATDPTVDGICNPAVPNCAQGFEIEAFTTNGRFYTRVHAWGMEHAAYIVEVYDAPGGGQRTLRYSGTATFSFVTVGGAPWVWRLGQRIRMVAFSRDSWTGF